MASKSNIVFPILSHSADGSLGSVSPFLAQIAYKQVSGKVHQDVPHSFIQGWKPPKRFLK